MRIERINENSIRCVLTNFDLSTRNVKLSELTYGSEKAKELFREMMQRAFHEVGFEAEDIPLMVEAIPMPNDSIMLIITKIDDPEELDTRFSRFSPEREEDDAPWKSYANELLEGADGLLNLLNSPEFLEAAEDMAKHALTEFNASKSTADAGSTASKIGPNAPDAPESPFRQMRIYQFDTLDLVCAAASHTGHDFSGSSVLYKNPATAKFHLVLKKESCDELVFSRVCNILSEYALRIKYEPATEAYYAEHFELFVKKDALQVLSKL